MTQADVGQLVGKTQSYVATKLRCLRLPAVASEALNDGRITEGHAKQLPRLDDDGYVHRLLQATLADDLSVRQLVREVDTAVRYIEADRALRAAEAALAELPEPDDKLLLACGCDLPWSDFWPVEDFRHCGNRRFGVFARMLYVAGLMTEQRAVCALGWGASQRVDLELVVGSMRRTLHDGLGGAAVVLANFPARCSDDCIEALVERLSDGIGRGSVLLCRVGTERMECAEEQRDRRSVSRRDGSTRGWLLCPLERGGRAGLSEC